MPEVTYDTHRSAPSRRRALAMTAGAAIATIGRSSAASSPDVEEFFRGRQLTLVIGNGPGGGFDVYGRLVARHISRYIPGEPNIVVQNMPGAGSLVAANYLYGVAPNDGTVFGLIARNMPLIGILGQNPNVRFDPSQFTWLGSSSDFATDAYLLVARKDSPVKSIADAIHSDGPEIVLGGTADGGSSNDVPRILHDTIGLNFKLVTGYRDSAAIYLAMESGEISGRTNEMSSLKTSHPGWLRRDGDYRVLLQYARSTRHPDLPDIPTARELAKNDGVRSLIEFTEQPFTMAWPFVAPPNLPEIRAHALRSAFMAVHRDPGFLADAAIQRVEINPVDGAKLSETIDSMKRAPTSTLDYMRKIMGPLSHG